MTVDPAADAIAEEILYLTGKSILSGDDAPFIQVAALPMVMETSDGCQLITAEDEVRGILAGVRKFMAENEYVDLVRTTISAKFLDEDTIEATHVSLLVGKNGETQRPPYPVHGIIRRFDGHWKLQSSMYVIADSDAHIKALSGGIKSRCTTKSRC